MRIAITGITGSLGSALLARLAREGADRIVGFSRDEQKRFNLARQYADHPGVKIYAGDVRDASRLVDIFAGCEVVVHAAARKVVSGHHDEPAEMHATNVLGTINVIDAARRAGVRKLLFISSDKAVQPTNVYGASKMMGEHLVVSANARTFAHGLRCGVIRYGNVLGSTGSVLPVWRARVAAGLPLQLSHRDMTRFWLPLEKAVDLVLRAVGDLRGGETFVPWLKAAPVKRLLAAVAGDRVLIEETGIRPGGEKMHEALLSEDEVRRAVRRNGWVIVPPADTPELWDRSPWIGEPVGEDFRYVSDTWDDEWTVDDLRAMLDTLGLGAIK